jgi:hypothetical protein
MGSSGRGYGTNGSSYSCGGNAYGYGGGLMRTRGLVVHADEGVSRARAGARNQQDRALANTNKGASRSESGCTQTRGAARARVDARQQGGEVCSCRLTFLLLLFILNFCNNISILLFPLATPSPTQKY